ncbi:MAG: hypothetical protein ACLQU4_01665 [Limisphaerales bacterium]
MKMRFAPLAVAALVTAFTVQAQYTEVNITPDVNADIQTYSYGNNYQLGGTTLTVAGVPFELAELGGSPLTTGVVQSSAAGGTAGSFDFTFSVPAGTEATALHSLANTAWGEPGVDEGSIVVTGTDGETATLTLTEGYNIRDHNQNIFVNTLSDPTVVPTYFENGAPTTSGYDQTRLDIQTLDLPSSFDGDTIASIQFEGYAHGQYDGGSAFLAGLTLTDASTAPDGPLPLPLIAGVLLAMLAVAGIRQNQVRRTN